MGTITIYPQSKEQANLFEQMARVLNVPFEREEESPYNPEFVAKIKKAEKAAKAGKSIKIKPADIWNLG